MTQLTVRERTVQLRQWYGSLCHSVTVHCMYFIPNKLVTNFGHGTGLLEVKLRSMIPP